MMLTDIHGVIAGPGADQGDERRAIIRAAVAAMPSTNPLVADDLIEGHTMHTEADDIVAIWKAAQRAAAQPVAQEAIPPGYVLISIDALRVWGKLDEVQDACKYSLADPQPSQGAEPLQRRVHPWLMACFGSEISADRIERNHRFLEEAIELVQSLGCTRSEAHQLVDYVFDRPVGEPMQEVGGVMITLAALCLASDLDMHEAGEVELARIWTMVEKIRAKQAAKPKHSPLPASPPQPVSAEADRYKRALEAIIANPGGASAKRIATLALGLDGTEQVSAEAGKVDQS